MLQSLFLKIQIGTYFVINMCALFSHKKFPHFLKKKIFFFKENMILVGCWKVNFRVLAPTSIYGTTLSNCDNALNSPWTSNIFTDAESQQAGLFQSVKTLGGYRILSMLLQFESLDAILKAQGVIFQANLFYNKKKFP